MYFANIKTKDQLFFLRKKSGSNASNVKVSFQTRTETTTETYTELGNTVSENQYDSLSRQDNYMNTNVS